MPGFPIYLQLLELTQTHVYRVGDAIQPSYPLSSPSPPAFTTAAVIRKNSQPGMASFLVNGHILDLG